MPVSTYKPGRFMPTIPRTGENFGAIFRGENMMLRGRSEGVQYLENYTGSLSLSESYSCVALSSTVSITSGSRTLTGTDLLNQLHPGQWLIVANQNPNADSAEIFVVESIESSTSATMTAAATSTHTGDDCYRMPVLFELNKKRGVLLRGNAVQFDKGNIIVVGEGINATQTLAINGAGVITTPTTFTFVDADVNTGTDVITENAHGLVTGQRVRLSNSGGALPTGL